MRELDDRDRADVVAYIKSLDAAETLGELRHLSCAWTAMTLMPLTTIERGQNAAILLALASGLTGHLVQDLQVPVTVVDRDQNLVTLVAARSEG